MDTLYEEMLGEVRYGTEVNAIALIPIIFLALMSTLYGYAAYGLSGFFIPLFLSFASGIGIYISWEIFLKKKLEKLIQDIGRNHVEIKTDISSLLQSVERDAIFQDIHLHDIEGVKANLRSIYSKVSRFRKYWKRYIFWRKFLTANGWNKKRGFIEVGAEFDTHIEQSLRESLEFMNKILICWIQLHKKELQGLSKDIKSTSTKSIDSLGILNLVRKRIDTQISALEKLEVRI